MTSDEEIQSLRGRCARLEIQLEIIKDILKDGFDRNETSYITEEYWTELHDKILALVVDKKKKPATINSMPTSPPPPHKRGVSFKDFKDFFS